MLSTKNKVGLVIAGLLGLADIPAVLMPTPEGEVGPPFGILVLGSICGVITVVAVVIAWTKANRGAIRVAAGARIVSMLTALPAFFVDVPVGHQDPGHRRRRPDRHQRRADAVAGAPDVPRDGLRRLP